MRNDGCVWNALEPKSWRRRNLARLTNVEGSSVRRTFDTPISLKILLVGNYAENQQESIQRYSDLLDRELRAAGQEVRLLHPSRTLARKWLPPGLGKWLAYVDRFLLFRWQFRVQSRWANVICMTDTANAILVPRRRTRPVVVTVHDLTAVRSALGELEHRTRWSGRVYQRWVLQGLKRADHIVCISEQTRAEVLRLVRCKPTGVSVVYNALNYPYRPMNRQESCRWLGRLGVAATMPFLLHVGNNSWSKNRAGVVEIFAEMLRACTPYTGQLVLAGKPWTDELRSLVAQRGLDRRVLEVVSPSNEGLRALYSSADVLLFPSLYEGFGWPIVEAQACGCIVVTSNRPPMPEVGGDAAVYIDPTDYRAAAIKIMATLVGSCAIRRDAGFANVSRFRTENMVNGYLLAYRLAAGRSAGGATTCTV